MIKQPVPTVSVLMTAYNRDQYIAQAIESVLASTFMDFELIVVDDGSHDQTVEVAKQYTSDPRVQVYVNQKNLGDYHNRNYAASLAQGKYLKYLDSDDYIYPHGLELMVQAMEQFPNAALGVERPPARDTPYPIQMSSAQVYREHFLIGGVLTCGPTGAILRTAAFHETGGFSGKRYIGDIEMWLKLAAKDPVVILMPGLVWWRQHEGQEFSLGLSSMSYVEWSYKVLSESLHSEKCPLSSHENRQAIEKLKRRHLFNILRLAFRQGRPQLARQIVKRTGFSVRDVYIALQRS